MLYLMSVVCVQNEVKNYVIYKQVPPGIDSALHDILILGFACLFLLLSIVSAVSYEIPDIVMCINACSH